MNALKGKLICVGMACGPRLGRIYENEYRSEGPLLFFVPYWGYATDEQYARLTMFQAPFKFVPTTPLMTLVQALEARSTGAKMIEARMEACNCRSTLMQTDLVAPDHQQPPDIGLGDVMLVRTVVPLGGPPTMRRWTVWEEMKAMALRRLAVMLNFVTFWWYKTHKEVEEQLAEG